MDPREQLIKQANIEQIAQEGSKIYEDIKGQYEPHDEGKFLAIDITSKQSYIGVTSAEAVEKARAEHPNTVFYVVKIGHSAAETLARMAERSL